MVNPVYILTLSCEDVIGIVAAVSGFLAAESCNIQESAQFFDHKTGRFFLRTVFASETGQMLTVLQEKFISVASRFGMDWQIHDADRRPPVLVLVSKFDHCLQALLNQHRAGSLLMDIVGIVSNHPDLQPVADFYQIPFHYFPVTSATKEKQEALIWSMVQNRNIELVILARYMQILSESLSRKLFGRCINIHHSFLPSFKGAKPYHVAHDYGVKIIGATAHYVTGDLDEGPIIEQETTRVNHAYTPEQMIEQGKHLENLVLTRAVRYHLEHRVIVNGRKTVVFGQ